MKKFLTAIAAAAMMLSCSGSQPDPVAQALEEAVKLSISEPCKFRLYTLELTDSTTFRTEFERRAKVFEVKSKREGELYARYVTEGKPKNAAVHMEAMTKANRNHSSLDSLMNSMASRLDDIAYYDYKFSGKAYGDSGEVEYRDSWFTITPAGKVLAITHDKKELHKNAGRAIPGYMEIFRLEEDVPELEDEIDQTTARVR